MTKKLDDATKMLVDSLPENLQKLATMSIENGYFSQSDFVEATTLDEIPDEEQAEVMDFFQQDLGLEVVESESYSKDMDRYYQDEEDDDCHVVNEVWLSDKQKWVMIDTDGGNFITDINNNPLSLQEIREHYIENKEMIMYPSFTKGSKKKDWYYGYMAKNTYWFSCWGDLSYSQEDWKNKNVVRDNYICLIPNKFTPFRVSEDDIITTNADLFWSEPKICYN